MPAWNPISAKRLVEASQIPGDEKAQLLKRLQNGSAPSAIVKELLNKAGKPTYSTKKQTNIQTR